jgi:hypothetical protein
MTPWQRRTLLGMLIALAALLNVAFNYAGPSLDLVLDGDSTFAMLGGLFAQACLLAAWVALGRQPLATRVPQALGVAALLGLAAAWGEARHSLEGGEGLSSATFMVFVAGIQAVLLLPWRRYWKWQLHTADHLVSAPSSQFSLRQLLLWTTAVAMILAVGRAIGLRHDASFADLAEVALNTFISLIVAAVCLPLAIPSISLILGGGKRVRATLWLVAVVIGSTLALFLTALVFDWLVNSGPWDSAVQDAVNCSVSLQAGFVGTLVLGLIVARLCGIRLSRGESNSTSNQPLSLLVARDSVSGSKCQPLPAGECISLAPTPWWRTRFACVAVALGLVVAALAWPSWTIELQRQESLHSQAINREWDKLGVDIFVQEGQITSATFQARQPVSDLALDKLIHSPHVDSLYSLTFSGALLTDDQMHHLAGLKNLRRLLLDGTQITDAGLAHLHGMSKLKVLNLNGTRIGDEGLQVLQDKTSLKELGLNDTNVTDAGLEQLRPLQELTALGLARTRVTDQGLPAVQRLPKLEVLLLQGTSVTPSGLAGLGGLPNLTLATSRGDRLNAYVASSIISDTPR